MKVNMNKIMKTSIIALLIVIVGMPSFAGQSNVKYTLHNLSNINMPNLQRHMASDTVNEVCIFCHTPHNAGPATPLWNKTMPTKAFAMYTSSKTLTPTARSVTAPGPESLLCLSCHDGRTAINILHNSYLGTDKMVDIGGITDDSPNVPGGGVSMATFGAFGGQYAANLGQTASDPYAGSNLTNDHPISVPYDSAYGESSGKLNNRIGMNPQIKFFGANHTIECSSCHDPHIDYGYGIDGIPTYSPTGNTALRPFLRISNSGSNLCLTCHNK
jgi:hypothetical protein